VKLLATVKRRLALAACCCLVPPSVAPGQSAQKAQSCQAEVFVPESLKNDQVVSSPDGHLHAVLGGYREEKDSESGWLRVFEGKRLIREYELKDLSGGIFVKWAPDSAAFYLMWSNGGMTGGYEVRVFRVGDEGVREVPAVTQALKEFTQKHHCHDRGENIYAVRWVGQSDDLMIATQVYPTSDCGKDMGFTAGYLVRIDDGGISARYSQSAVETEMKNCPSAIWPTGFWGDDTLKEAKTKLNENPDKPGAEQKKR
jgi:hypothetical protein